VDTDEPPGLAQQRVEIRDRMSSWIKHDHTGVTEGLQQLRIIGETASLGRHRSGMKIAGQADPVTGETAGRGKGLQDLMQLSQAQLRNTAAVMEQQSFQLLLSLVNKLI